MQLRKDKKRKQGANRLVPQTECRFSRDFLSWEVVGKPEGTTPEKVIAKTKKLRKSYEKLETYRRSYTKVSKGFATGLISRASGS
jgi:hypothetical protein